MHLSLIDGHVDAIAELTTLIEAMIAPIRATRELLVSIPGVSTRVAEVIIAETGT